MDLAVFQEGNHRVARGETVFRLWLGSKRSCQKSSHLRFGDPSYRPPASVGLWGCGF